MMPSTANNASLLFVNYHYIRDPAQYKHPGIHPISPDAFAAQVDWLSDRFHMATPAEAEAFVWGESTLSSDSVVLTFDDGLTDQYEVAVTVLDPRGIKGVFFVTSQPLTDGHANTLQKMHWLRATTKPDTFQNQLFEQLPLAWRDRIGKPDAKGAAERIYIYDTPEVGRVKYLINFILPDTLADEISSAMLLDRGIVEADFCAATYMREEHVRNLHQTGHMIGAHGHRHIPFTRIPEGDSMEIEENISTLTAITSVKPAWVSYPFGRDWAVPADPEKFCRRYRFRIGLSLNVGWNSDTESPFLLNRVNTNEVEAIADERFPEATGPHPIGAH